MTILFGIVLVFCLSSVAHGFCVTENSPPSEYEDQCTHLSPKEAAEKFDLIFIGRTTEIKDDLKKQDKQNLTCSKDRHMAVVRQLRGPALKKVWIRGNDGCRIECSSKLVNHTWIVFAKKNRSHWEYDQCGMSHAVADPFPDLEDLEARFQWKKAQAANGLVPAEFKVEDLGNFKSSELLPLLIGVLPRLKECGELDLFLDSDFPESWEHFRFDGTIGKDGKLQSPQAQAKGAVPYHANPCVSDIFSSVLYPRPHADHEGTFSLKLKFQTPVIRRITYLSDFAPRSSRIRPGLAIGHSRAAHRNVVEVFRNQPQIIDNCRPRTKFVSPSAWEFAARLSFVLNPTGDVIKGSAKLEPVPRSRPPASKLWNDETAAKCITAELEKVRFPSPVDDKDRDVLLTLRVFPTR